MKIIDWKKKGNVVRFFLGADSCEDYWGDDWNDTPYEHNAGQVYDEYVVGYADYFFPFDAVVLEPADDWSYRSNSPFCKEDFKNRMAPCVIIIPWDIWHKNEWTWEPEQYSHWMGADNIYKVYFGDNINHKHCGEIKRDIVKTDKQNEEDG